MLAKYDAMTAAEISRIQALIIGLGAEKSADMNPRFVHGTADHRLIHRNIAARGTGH